MHGSERTTFLGQFSVVELGYLMVLSQVQCLPVPDEASLTRICWLFLEHCFRDWPLENTWTLRGGDTLVPP